MQCSLKGSATDTVCSLSTEALLNSTVRKLTVIYGSVKCFYLLIRDFYTLHQEEEETILLLPIGLKAYYPGPETS